MRKSQAVWRLGSTVAVWGLGVSSCTVRMPCVVGPPRLDIGAYEIIEACIFEACVLKPANSEACNSEACASEACKKRASIGTTIDTC